MSMQSNIGLRSYAAFSCCTYYKVFCLFGYNINITLKLEVIIIATVPACSSGTLRIHYAMLHEQDETSSPHS